MMLFHTDRKPLKYNLVIISVSVFQLILTQFCTGQSQLIGASQPIVATFGEDIILPCQLEPKKDVAGLTLEWTRPDLTPRFVHVWRSGKELIGVKHQSFEGRTSLFINELKNGNISLKLSELKLSDGGTYRCFIPSLEKQSFVQLVIASNAASLPVVTLAGLETTSSGVVLQCESKGWNPEPEVLWLDGEGHVLSAGPTEIVRGPDDLYTVSSRVTVDKRHGNRFTCRVQQTIINQTRETHMQVSDDFFYVQSSIFPVTVGLVVSVAVCILSFLAIVLLWRKKNSSKCKIRQLDENDKGQRNICFKPGKTKDQIFIEEKGERETLMVDKTEQMEEMDGKRKKKKNKTSKIHQKKEEAEITVKNLEEELETKRTEVENKESELQQLHEENQEREKNLQTVKDKLEAKNKELQTVKAQIDQRRFTSFSKETLQTKKTVVEKEVETLKKQLETMETESQTRITEIQDKQADVQRLKDGIQKMETNQQMNDNTESGRSGAAPVQSPSCLIKLQIVSKQRFREEKKTREELETEKGKLEANLEKEQQEREKAEREVGDLKNQLEEKNKELERKVKEETRRREEAEREAATLRSQQEKKNKELNQLLAEYKKLELERQQQNQERGGSSLSASSLYSRYDSGGPQPSQTDQFQTPGTQAVGPRLLYL